MTTLQTRALTGFAFATTMAIGIFYNFYSFLGLFSLITALSLWEFYGLVLPEEPSKRLRMVYATSAGLLVLIGFYANQALLFSNSGYSSLIGLVPIVAFFYVFALFVVELFLGAEKPFNNIGLVWLGFVYIVVPYCILATMVCTNDVQNGQMNYQPTYHPALVFGLLGLVWSSDSMAYLVGSRFGKTKLFSRISPGKTWEGSFGGLIGAFIAVALIHFVLFPNELNLKMWLILAVFAVVFGTLGDLIESMLKRSLGVKDSGSLLPGHGGMLDRFDAFMYLVPWAWLALHFGG